MKQLLIFVVFLVFLVFVVDPVRSQEANTFTQAQSDYLVQLDKYTTAEGNYQLAKAQYEQAGTLVSETNAKNATISLLRERDNLLVRYLVMLRRRIEENNDIANVIKSGLLTRIDTEIDWFEEHASRVSSAGTLEDLVEDSNVL